MSIKLAPKGRIWYDNLCRFFRIAESDIKKTLGDAMELIANIKGYHVNDFDRCKAFVDLGIPIFSEDTHYLGFGMYFWDNNRNAKFWLNEKKKKNNKLRAEDRVEKFAKVSTNIIIENILDLTDTDIINSLSRLWSEYCEKEGCAKQLPIGEKLDRLFDYFNLNSTFSVIRVYVKYKNKSDSYFFEFGGEFKLTSSVNQIYSVRDKKVMAQQELMEVYEA